MLLRTSLLLLLLVSQIALFGQGVGINNATPDASALLDLTSSGKGLLVPRLTTIQRDAVPAPATSLLIFNTTTAQFEYFDGVIWRALLSSSAAGWGLNGNTGTNSATNFIGTTDNQALRFRVNNTFAGHISTVVNGQVSLGINAGPVSTGTANTFVGGGSGMANSTGGSNTFLGQGAGASNTTRQNNTYVGARAGESNETGQENVYVGRLAGGNGIDGSGNVIIGNAAGISNTANNNVIVGGFAGNSNTSGGGNTFVGRQTGQANTTGGQNTFIGLGAGNANTVGSGNTLLGNSASLNANNLTHANAIGAGSRVDVNNGFVLGRVNGINGATSSSLVGIGTTAPAERLHVVGSIRMVDGNQAAGRVLVSDLNGTASWQQLTALNANAWGLTGNSGTNSTTNFIGTTDFRDLVFRVNNTLAGTISADQFEQLSYGLNTGSTISTTANTFLGNQLPAFNPSGSHNTLVGFRAGSSLIGGFGNIALGSSAGGNCTSGGRNIVIGYLAGSNITTGSNNLFIGANSGGANSTGNQNILIGDLSNVASNGLVNAIAIGTQATVGASNSMALGGTGALAVKVGISVTTPVAKFQTYSAPNGSKLQITQGLLSAGHLITTDFTANAYTPGLFWSTANNNATLPKAGIFLQETNAGTKMFLATSDDYTSGITNDAMVIDPAGNIGFETVTPDRHVELEGTGDQYLRVTSRSGSAGIAGIELKRTTFGASDWQIRNEGGLLLFGQSANDLATVNDVLRLGGGSVTPATDANVNCGAATLRWSNVFATNGTINTSDAREKTNVRNLNYGLSEIMDLRPVRFQWKNSLEDGDKIGLIAQELQKILPETVVDKTWQDNDDGTRTQVPAERLGVYYSDLIPVLVSAIQEQQAQIESLRAELELIRTTK